MLKPLGSRILVQREKEKEVTSSGIILPSDDSKKSRIAKVVAVGKGTKDKDGKLIKPTIKVGDKVLLGNYGGDDVTYDDVDYTIVDEKEILAIVE